MAEPVFIDEIIKKVVHDLFTLRKAKSVVFTFLTNQQSAIQSVNLHPHPWGR